jgi:hypothetical protein
MAIETNNNYDLKKAASLDARLNSVETANDLISPTAVGSFLYEGATVYVKSEKANYRVEKNSSNVLVWVKQTTENLVLGVITITASTTQLDLSTCTPSIDKCFAVRIDISGGTTATLQTIINSSTKEEIMFYVKTNQSVTFKHTDYDVANNGVIILEDGLDITITGRTVGNEMLWLQKQSTVFAQKGAVQYLKTNEWVSQALSILVEDNLYSNAVNRALSARQGKVLDETKQNKIIFDQNTLLEYNETSKILYKLPNTYERINITWNNTLLGNLYNFAFNVPGFLVSIAAPQYHNKDRYVDLNFSSTGSNSLQPINFGIWVLPANADKNLTSSWFNVQKNDSLYSVQYNCVGSDLDLETDNTGSGIISVPISLNNNIGPLGSFFNFNTLQGFATKIFTFTPKYFTGNEIYELECSLSFKKVGLDPQPISLMLYENTNGLVPNTQINGVPTGATIIAKDSNYNNGSTFDPSYYNLKVKAAVSPFGEGYTFLLSCPHIVANKKFLGLTLEATSYIRITKLN